MTIVTGNLFEADGSPAVGATVSFALQCPPADFPRISGSSEILIFDPPTVTADSTGRFTASIYGNDIITPQGTTYAVTFKFGTHSITYRYLIGGATVDLSLLAPLGGITIPVPPVSNTSVSIIVTPSNPGNLAVTHGLGRTPVGASLLMVSGGQIWFQFPLMWDINSVYLVASDFGTQAMVILW